MWVVSTLADFCDHVACFRPLAGCGLFLPDHGRAGTDPCFRPLAGCGLFPGYRDGSAALLVSVPLRGVGCFPFVSKIMSAGLFPSPCGVWVVSSKRMPKRMKATEVSVPLRGVGCFGMDFTGVEIDPEVSVPLRGVGCFRQGAASATGYQGFPSPCGVWVVSAATTLSTSTICFRPLAGCGLFPGARGRFYCQPGFRPLAGCGLFRFAALKAAHNAGFRPLAGCGLFHEETRFNMQRFGFPSPCGVWVVSRNRYLYRIIKRFPSPCGVWVVSAKLHILSGATGKRIVNSAILLYHIGRCLSIAN